MMADKSELKEGLDSLLIKVMTQMLKVPRGTVIHENLTSPSILEAGIIGVVPLFVTVALRTLYNTAIQVSITTQWEMVPELSSLCHPGTVDSKESQWFR